MLLLIILLMRYRLNVLSLGDHEARSLGVNLKQTRGIFILCSTLISASCICLSGTIGWVGLIIPHTSRMLVGSDNFWMGSPCGGFLSSRFPGLSATFPRHITLSMLIA